MLGALWNHLHVAYSTLKASKLSRHSLFPISSSPGNVTLEVIYSPCNGKGAGHTATDHPLWALATAVLTLATPHPTPHPAGLQIPRWIRCFAAPTSFPPSHLTQPCGQEEGGKITWPSAPEMGIPLPSLHKDGLRDPGLYHSQHGTFLAKGIGWKSGHLIPFRSIIWKPKFSESTQESVTGGQFSLPSPGKCDVQIWSVEPLQQPCHQEKPGSGLNRHHKEAEGRT